jgi:hypothetical protein
VRRFPTNVQGALRVGTEEREMTLMLAALLLSAPLAATGQTPPAPPAQAAPQLPACVVPPRFAAIATDPVSALTVNTTKHFVIALRAVEDGGFAWRLLDTPDKNAPVRAEGMQSVGDVVFANLERKAGDPPIVGGSATEMFLFTAMAPGSQALTFGLFAPGADAPTRTVAFAVHVAPNVVIC